MKRRAGLRGVVFFLVCGVVNACATTPAKPLAAPRHPGGVPVRENPGPATLMPPGVTIEDGLTADEAIAVALWNNAEFRLQLTELGFARADLAEAGLLRNPVLSLLFPVGPKQLEATLRFPIEVLWERPRRVAAANLAVDRVAAGLEQFGLNLASDVRIGFIDLGLARDRLRLSAAAAAELEEIGRITDRRFRAGDISELEARTAAIDATRARQEAIRAQGDVTIREHALRARLGLALQSPAALLVPAPFDGSGCRDRPGLLEEALAARPDVRAAEIGVEAAAARLGWEKSRVMTVSAVLDANGAGKEGFEMGPGVDLGIPLFERNQGGRARGAVDLQRAGLAYSAARQRVAAELTEALALLAQARAMRDGWNETIVRPLERQVDTAQRAFAAGDVSYLFVLEMGRRLTDARLRAADTDADVARAAARVERAIGRPCASKGLQP